MADHPAWVANEKYQTPKHQWTYRREVTEVHWGPVDAIAAAKRKSGKEEDWPCCCTATNWSWRPRCHMCERPRPQASAPADASVAEHPKTEEPEGQCATARTAGTQVPPPAGTETRAQTIPDQTKKCTEQALVPPLPQ